MEAGNTKYFTLTNTFLAGGLSLSYVENHIQAKSASLVITQVPKEFQNRQLKIHVKVPPLVHIASSGGHDLYQTKFRKPQRNRSTRGSREENFQG